MWIVIFAKEKKDPFVSNISLWLNSMNVKVTVIYESDLTPKGGLTVVKSSKEFNVEIKLRNGEVINSKQVNVFFQRKELLKNISTADNEHFFLNSEYNAVYYHIGYELKKQGKLFGYCPQQSKIKLIQLAVAQECGFEVPETLITNNLDSPKLVFGNQTVVNKAIQEVYVEKGKNGFETNYTHKVSAQNIEADFEVSLFQEMLDKRTEIRVFVFENEVYGVAASLKVESEEVDIRILMAQRAVEYYKYDLPLPVKQNLIRVREKLMLDMYSADLILSKEGDYFMIDVNPFGQISMLTQTCYAHLESRIAKKLMEYGEE